MKAIFTWLFGIDRVTLDAADHLQLHWQTPHSRWVMTASCLVLIGVVVRTYFQQSLTTRRRALLCVTRLAVVAIVLLAIGQPVLVLEREIIESATVTVMVDASASMGVSDVSVKVPISGTISRFDRAVSLLTQDGFTPLKTLAQKNAVAIQSFSDDAQSIVYIPRGDADGVSYDDIEGVTPVGDVTDIAKTITNRLNDRRIRHAGIVVLSDGRTSAASDIAAAIQVARATQTPVHCVALGSAKPPVDASVVRTNAPQLTFADDIAIVATELRVTGIDKPHTIIVRFIDEETERQIDVRTVQVDSAESTQRVEAHIQPPRGGSIPIRVEIDQLDGESTVENNVARVKLNVIDRELRVLYVEGYPRYEYRYLKNALLREPSIRLSCILLSADIDFAQEGVDPIRRFPETREEFERFDVVLWGDVDPFGEWITEPQRQLLIEQVSRSGCGFAVIAGQRYAPSGFTGSPLERLIPIRVDRSLPSDRTRFFTQAFSPRLTQFGEHSPLFRFDADPERSRQMFDSLPPIFWSAPVVGPQPGAQVLLQRDGQRPADLAQPLVVSARYGAGKTLIQLTDDTWRWRRHDGELLHDAYWVRLIRSLAPDRIDSSDRVARFVSDRQTYQYGDKATFRLTVRDPDVLEQLPDALPITVTDHDGAPIHRLTLERTVTDTGVYHASLVVDQIGGLNLTIDEWPSSLSSAPTLSIQSSFADAETRDTRTDHTLLRKLAEQTGGMFIQPDEWAIAVAKIPDQSVRIPNDVTHSLWDSKLALCLFAVLLSIEWSVRRFGGLS